MAHRRDPARAEAIADGHDRVMIHSRTRAVGKDQARTRGLWNGRERRNGSLFVHDYRQGCVAESGDTARRPSRNKP